MTAAARNGRGPRETSGLHLVARLRASLARASVSSLCLEVHRRAALSSPMYRRVGVVEHATGLLRRSGELSPSVARDALLRLSSSCDVLLGTAGVDPADFVDVLEPSLVTVRAALADIERTLAARDRVVPHVVVYPAAWPGGHALYDFMKRLAHAAHAAHVPRRELGSAAGCPPIDVAPLRVVVVVPEPVASYLAQNDRGLRLAIGVDLPFGDDAALGRALVDERRSVKRYVYGAAVF